MERQVIRMILWLEMSEQIKNSLFIYQMQTYCDEFFPYIKDKNELALFNESISEARDKQTTEES